jgi:predicted lipoprotein
LLASACVLPSCRHDQQRSQILRDLVERVVVPNTAALVQSSGRLRDEIARLSVEPTLLTLGAARAQWQRTLLSWKRADVFRSGPIMDANGLLRAMFWPVRTGAIEALVQSSQALDEASIDAIGVDRRGLFALEYLLYPQASAEGSAAQFTGANGERRTQLARALTGNVLRYADQALRSLAASEIEGGSSGMSQQIALTYLQATEQLYLGANGGICQLVRAQSSTADEGIRSDFRQAIALISNLGLPLEQAAGRDVVALDTAALAVKKLERALKTELTSTLGVTLTFSSVDGD